MKKQPEKRQSQRNPFPQPIMIEWSDDENGSFEAFQNQGRGVDITSQGIGILTEGPFQRGQVVKVYVPIGTAAAIIATFSVVRWVRHTERHNRVGLQFLA
jgi:hypothetical protein